jgi:hypothetical protein
MQLKMGGRGSSMALHSTGMTTMRNGLSDASTPYMPNGADLDDACSAIPHAKAEHARARKYIQVFLSHKQKDYKAAEQIREVLRINSAGRIHVFLSENIAKGDDWQDEIEKELHRSDWFLLLFAGQDDDWSWCHHEAGIFRGMMYPDADRVVVFYPPNVALPDPLKKYQAVKCAPPSADQPDHLDRFFKEMFGKPPYPGHDSINPVFAHEALGSRRDAANRIIQAIGGLVVESMAPEYVMIVHVPDVSQLGPAGFPQGTNIRRGSGAMRLFELGDKDFAWRDFLDRLEPDLQHGLSQSFWPAIHQACAKCVKSRRLVSTHTVLRSPLDGRHYMPVLSRVDITGDNSATFHLAFVQVAAGTQATVRDKSVARIFTALNLAHRFRWEIIDRYSHLDRLKAFVEHHAQSASDGGNGTDLGNGLGVIWEAIRLLETESLNRGVYDENALPADFGPAEGRVRAMFPLWNEKRAALERAAADGDIANFARGLAELNPVNVEFISLASQRLGELVRADAHHGSG